ncbi:hypothetical protein Pla52n_57630 [Stieleria varia]|uniref:Uncharacterized protein n=1 Tax=Stieleria varia TaxID=2528005 RepID=A0A5C6A3I5_9BACT|nr:hypothetical protein Pla52n_57630 [Stieleria varia]
MVAISEKCRYSTRSWRWGVETKECVTSPKQPLPEATQARSTRAVQGKARPRACHRKQAFEIGNTLDRARYRLGKSSDSRSTLRVENEHDHPLNHSSLLITSLLAFVPRLPHSPYGLFEPGGRPVDELLTVGELESPASTESEMNTTAPSVISTWTPP